MSKAWIQTGEGDMFPVWPAGSILRKISGVPFYPDFPRNRPPSGPDKILYFSKELIHNADFAVLCRTDELIPLYKKDSILFLRRWALKDPIIFGEVYFVKTNYGGFFRIIRKVKNEKELGLECPNKKRYDRLIIPLEDITELYIVL